MSRVVICCAILAAAARLPAQEIESQPAPLFLERSAIFQRLPVDNLTFEGQIAPHLFFTRSNAWERGDVLEAPHTALVASFTPMVRLRMLSTTSHPVRTPSYMPRPLLDWQIIRASAAETDDRSRLDGTAARRVWALTITPWAHHSNGQDGCLYTYQTRTADGDCIGTRPAGTIPVPNKIDGSFSTNFVHVGVGYAYAAHATPLNDNVELRDRCSLQFDAEYHPLNYLVGGLSGEQEEFYPQVQLQLGAEWTGWWKGQWILGANTRWLDNTAPGVPHWVHTVEADFSPRTLEGWGGFARFYTGMDYYNLGFMEKITYLQLGFVWDLGRTPQVQAIDVAQTNKLPAYPKPSLLDRIPGAFDAVCRALH